MTDSGSEQARQFRRHEVSFESRIEPHAEHVGQFRLCVPDAQAGLAVVDVSRGGVGVRSALFVPKNMRLVLHVSGVCDDSGTARILRIRAVTRQCVMVDHKPTYQIGMQFLEPEGEEEQILIKAASAPGQPVETAGGST